MADLPGGLGHGRHATGGEVDGDDGGAGVVGPDGATHAGNLDLSFLRCVPNMVVMAPADEAECRQMLSTGLQHRGPAAVRYPRGTGPGVAPGVDLSTLPIGKAQLRAQGHRLAILAFGSTVAAAEQVGRELGLPEVIVGRQPFPGPGLGIRIIGAVDGERLDTLRRADAIAREEMTAAGLDDVVWQCPVVLLADVRSVGVQGDGRTYGHPIVLRPVSSEDAMTADWTRVPYDVLERISTRITNEVPEVNRVVLDITSKPPGTIEWE